MNPVAFIQQVRGELTKVTWPTRKQTMEMTVVVVVVSAIIGVYITGLDALFTRVTQFLLK